MLPYDSRLKKNSRALRCNMTDAEQKLWQRLRRKQINGWQFYRQKPIGQYIVDFYCSAANLVIEIDGGQHFEAEHQLADQKRDEYMNQLGLRVLRFDNRQVLLETDAVVEVIRKSPPNPPFSKGGANPAPATSLPPFEKGRVNPAPANSLPPFEKGGPGGICPNPDEAEQQP
ncbi:endonuclease domain-containing protein [Methylomonas methanica]|uniref:endonuclease domain-containing protein n=1 Tax=Methylomonas methanica TaxID=421 RepID=UPI0009EDAAEE|nr:endonuclease domain-containing protein [Methylomonas methanica]